MSTTIAIRKLRSEFSSWLDQNRDALPVNEVEKFSELLKVLDEMILHEQELSRKEQRNYLFQVFRLIVSIMNGDLW